MTPFFFGLSPFHLALAASLCRSFYSKQKKSYATRLVARLGAPLVKRKMNRVSCIKIKELQKILETRIKTSIHIILANELK
jgi:hypothetical protein